MKKWLSALILVMLVFSLAACGQSDEKTNEGKKETASNEVFKIGAIPDQNAADLDKGMTATAKYLSEKTGMKVEFVPSVDYAALVTGFQRGEIHMAWFGGLTSVQARNLVPEAESDRPERAAGSGLAPQPVVRPERRPAGQVPAPRLSPLRSRTRWPRQQR